MKSQVRCAGIDSLLKKGLSYNTWLIFCYILIEQFGRQGAAETTPG